MYVTVSKKSKKIFSRGASVILNPSQEKREESATKIMAVQIIFMYLLFFNFFSVIMASQIQNSEMSISHKIKKVNPKLLFRLTSTQYFDIM